MLFDPRDGSVRRVPVRTPSSAPETARRFVDAGELLETWQPSHDGTALALVSRGHAFTMPLWEEAVTLYGGDGARRRLAGWLPGDKRLAYVDDTAGYERIALAPVDQSAPPAYVTDENYGVLHELAVAPAGERIAFATNRHELWLLDLGGAPRRLDTSVGERIADLAFSPDGAWLAYTQSPKAHTSIIRLAECATRPAGRRDHPAARGPLAGLGPRRRLPLLHLDPRLPPGLRRAAVRAELPRGVAPVSAHPARDPGQPVHPQTGRAPQAARPR